MVRKVQDDRQLLELALVENLQRADLNPIEEAEAYRALQGSFGLSHDPNLIDLLGATLSGTAAEGASFSMAEVLPEGVVSSAIVDGDPAVVLPPGVSSTLLYVEYEGKFPETPYAGGRGYLPHRTPRAAYAATISRILGARSGWLGVLGASLVGAVTLIPGFVAFPTAAMLLRGGAGYMQIGAFISSLMMVGVITLPVEIRYFGGKVAAVRNVLAFVFSFLVAAVIGAVCR